MKKKVLGIFLVLSMAAISAEKNIETKIQNENGLIKKVEKNKLAIDTIKKQHSADLKEIENKYEAKEIELIKKSNKIENKFNSLWKVLAILGSISLCGISYFIKISKNKIYKKIADVARVNKDSIEEIVNKHDKEMELKRTKKICILSVDNENKGEIKKILKGFDCREYKSIDDNINFKDYDLILINHNADFNIEIINKMITDNENSYFFYYGSEKVISSNMKKNYCNSIFTLYGNLIDLLRTQDLLKK